MRIDQNRKNLSNLDSAFEKTCIPIPIPYSQTSCLKAGFVKFGSSSLVFRRIHFYWTLNWTAASESEPLKPFTIIHFWPSNCDLWWFMVILMRNDHQIGDILRCSIVFPCFCQPLFTFFFAMPRPGWNYNQGIKRRGTLHKVMTWASRSWYGMVMED